jgi:hypothetical protein
MPVTAQRFTTSAEDGGRGRLLIAVPFDPDVTWGSKSKHHVSGTVAGHRVRGVIERHGAGYALTIGAMWRRDCGVAVGETVAVELRPEGPQREELADDIAAALAADPAAAAFFDSLAQFYRKAYVRWIEATRRDPALRARRITEVTELLHAGLKERPNR